LIEGEYPIFYDPRERRWRRVRLVGLIFAVSSTLLAALFIASVLVNPILPQLELHPAKALPQMPDTKLKPPRLILTRREARAHRAVRELKGALRKTKYVPGAYPARIVTLPSRVALSASSSSPLAIGFYVNWDDSSYASLKRNLNDLDWLVPAWFKLTEGADSVRVEIDPRALDLIRRERPQLAVLPLIQNYSEDHWDGALVARAVATEDGRRKLISALVDLLERNGFAGLVVDFEEVPAGAQADLLRFVRALHAELGARGLTLAQAVPFDNPDWDYQAYQAATDYLMLMAYDEHWASGAPGPVASQRWFEKTLAHRMRELDPTRTVICLGNYGYDWSDGDTEATELTFQEAVLAARDSTAHIAFDRQTLNPSFTYEDEDGAAHTVWFLDAVTAYNQMHTAGQYHPAGFALWRLGSEDPSVWNVFGRTKRSFDGAESLRLIRYGYDIDFEGVGEILQIEAAPQDGERDLQVDAQTGLIVKEDYTVIPSSYVIRRVGDRPGYVALTFDDGPDPKWTPLILDILKREGVPATFFIIGENGQAHPDLVRRIFQEGHEIGNHTYTHPNLGEVPARITELELNATERLIEALTGHSTLLFRPPYFGDAEPTTPDEIEPIAVAKRLGYITVGLHVDPEDWKLTDEDGHRRTAADIARETIEGVTSSDPERRGEVVLLHDGGGDRSETVRALPEIIRELRARGYRFVTVSELAGLKREQTMPPIAERRDLFAYADGVAFALLSAGGWLLHWLFLIGIALGLGRLLFIGALAFAQWVRAHRRERQRAGIAYEPFVSVLVPAYNEERVIVRTIESLLASNYPSFEVIVVDDGSSDRTYEVARARFASESRVRVFRKGNGGKADALNFGLRRARGEIIVALDADTIFAPETLRALAQRFHDPRIGAVAGNAKVGNRINLITRWQALEYITSQNLDRRAFASLNCITVVPGAVGAWRRELIARAGGFSGDTLAEDQDLTLRIRRLGCKIGYEERAIAWTEAPDTIRGLARQRFRWSFGTLQCMWKHRDALFRLRYGALGFIALPNVWIFQIIFPLISPVMDLVLIWDLVSALLDRFAHGAEYASSSLQRTLFYYALFLALDWIASAFAFLLEKREQWGLLWWLFWQRFGYRQMMYYVMLKSVLTALRGALVGWGKLERKATVEAPY
jgi:cellulose synthase/poly-beta-1,6-N-acetylglucosamine synthase-like glycosyltransferase/peptidoglycan/xylan/chitin deacetylase (PgdA/CDA1 family)/spore germination protein YaaH